MTTIYIILAAALFACSSVLISIYYGKKGKYEELLSKNRIAIERWLSDSYSFKNTKAHPVLVKYWEQNRRGPDTTKFMSFPVDVEHLPYKVKKKVIEHISEIKVLYQMDYFHSQISNAFSNQIRGLRYKYYPSFLLKYPNEMYDIDVPFSPRVLSITTKSYPAKFCLDHIDALDAYVEERECKRIKENYSDGYNELLKIGLITSNAKDIIEKEQSIKNKDKEIKDERNLLAKWYDNWEKSQSSFAKFCRNERDNSAPTWGCYPYDIKFNKKNDDGSESKGKYRVWQFFIDSYCSACDIELNFNYPYYESCKKMYSLLDSYYSCQRIFKNSVYDKILNFIDSIRKEENIIVYFSSSNSPKNITEKHFSYLKEKLESRTLYGGFINDINNDVNKSCKCIIIDLITENVELYKTCEKLVHTHQCAFEAQHKKSPKINDSYFDIAYISIVKEYDREEMIEIIKEEEKKRDYINKNKQFAKNYPNGLKKVFPNLSPDSLSYKDAQNIESKKKEIEEYERTFQEEYEKQQRLVNLTKRLKESVYSWDRVGTVPHYFFYWYYSVKAYGENVSEHSKDVRSMIFNFKDGRDYSGVVDIVTKKIQKTFNTNDISSLVFVGIPASSQDKNRRRYSGFLSSLCRETGMINGYSYVQVTEDREAAHMGAARGVVNYTIDADWFDGKFVVIFDDIVTQGKSLQQFASILQDAGAQVICAMSIGKTYYSRYSIRQLTDPWVSETSRY